MGEALRGGAGGRGGRGSTAARGVGRRTARRVAALVAAPLLALLVAVLPLSPARLAAQASPTSPAAPDSGAPPAPPPGAAFRLDSGRFTVVAYPRDAALARALLADALRRDTFPGLPRPRGRVLLAIAPDRRTFREWVGPAAPEWGAAIAFPESRRIVMQGRNAGSDAGDPIAVARHELAHLALHEFLGDLPPRWFDEGYASYSARELERDELLATNVALALGGMPSLEALDSAFYGGSTEAQSAYALAYRAVADLAELDPQRGLSLFFEYWRASGSLEVAVRSAYGITVAAYEKRWQTQTRRRYGALAVFADLTLATLLLLAVMLPLYFARRSRDRRRMRALREADEAAERRERESAIDDLLRSLPPPAPPGSPTEQR
jgi:hypothetical protein